MSRAVPIPVGDHPAWEHEDQSMNIERAPWHSVADSLVLLQSLKQSRDRWLSSAFPKLPKPRGSKQAGHNIPVHEYKAHDRFELSVGPHIFPDTYLFEAIYSYTNDRNAALRPTDFISPEMAHLLVTTAAQDNPVLSQLLAQSVSQRLSEEENSTLRRMLQPLLADRLVTSAVAQSHTQPLAWDLIVEFKEKPSDRRIFPRGSVQLERIRDTGRGKRFDAMVITTLPYTQQQIGVDLQASGQQEPMTMPNHENASPQPVTFHWRGLTQRTYDLLVRWSSASQPLDPTTTGAQLLSRVYLPYQLPDGELLDMIRAAVSPPYTMKSVRPANADSGRTKRRVTRRKSAVDKPTAAAATFSKPANDPPPALGGQFSTFSVAQMVPPPAPPAPPPVLPAAEHPIPLVASRTADASGSHAYPHYRSLTTTSPPQVPIISSTSDSAHGAQPPHYRPHTTSTPTSQPQAFPVSHISVPQPVIEIPPATPSFSQPRTQVSEPSSRRKKSRYEQPPPSCKACHRSNVQLMHGGRYCRECVEAKRFMVPEVVVPRRSPIPAPLAGPSRDQQPAHYAHLQSEGQSPIVPGTQFSHWTPPPN